MPILAASWITGHGVSSRSSHSSAAGRTTPSAKPCTHSRMSFWSWLSSSVNCGSLGASDVELASSSSACASTSATEESAMAAKSTRNGVVSRNRDEIEKCLNQTVSDIAKVEGAQAFRAPIRAVEEALIDAAVGLAAALVGALDREGAMRKRVAGHLDAAEAALLQHRAQLHLGRVDLLHAADVLLAGKAVDVAVEVAAAELDAAARLDHLVAEGAALAALANLGARRGHPRSLGMPYRGTKRFGRLTQRGAWRAGRGPARCGACPRA